MGYEAMTGDQMKCMITLNKILDFSAFLIFWEKFEIKLGTQLNKYKLSGHF